MIRQRYRVLGAAAVGVAAALLLAGQAAAQRRPVRAILGGRAAPAPVRIYYVPMWSSYGTYGGGYGSYDSGNYSGYSSYSAPSALWPSVPTPAYVEPESEYTPEYSREEGPQPTPIRQAAAESETGQVITFQVRLATDDALLWVDGTKTNRTGKARRFVSPPLAEGRSYTYRFQVQWALDGRLYTEARDVTGSPGDRITVNFTRPGPATQVEVVPREAPAPKQP